ncbi:RB1-inducible coiled-coil protein 1 isoform X2 [Octopus bimaculoides]|uniref:RB1-inducible coiled-coil protein 1 isoform X2 n=1 Tax=Octopus bimaculoides TaxID=37653 RepID=UPI00071DC885|nr:RB1-inducible coiled-coil protein 1 isoform X2 [Octopus bimaculoides]|eukprot:XP_014777857.1 PREDICTED: RB1-inducible coiled-coil protein 1-like isoform X2 [Octopus bimaculoides]
MLYVFLVELGQMLTIDTCYTTETVSVLKSHVARLCRIAPDKQVMLVSGGISLDNSCRVGHYCAGTDTNPIFVFSKVTIEANIPPSPCINYGTDKVLTDAISEVVLLPATHETVSDAYKLAKETVECDKSRMEASERLIHDQHLQQQGWAAAIANLDDHLASFNRRVEKFQSTCNIFLKTQEESLEMLSNVPGILRLLGRIPLLNSLQTLVSSPLSQTNPVEPAMLEDVSDSGGHRSPSLLDWIYQQDPRSSLEDMVEQCRVISEQISQKNVEKLMQEIDDMLKFIDRPDMKEVKGLENRLYQLDHLITNTRTIMDKQTKFYQKFSSQLETTSRMDCECLSEYWKNHKKDLMDLSEGHNQIKIFRKRCCKAKEELSKNLHVRLQWVMYVEQLIMEKERKIKIESEKIKRQRKHLKILQQVHDSAKMYINALVEIIRRKNYSTQFLTWARNVAATSHSLYIGELQDRQNFSETFNKHFIQSLFHGLHDEPSKFATTPPRTFDHNIPEITSDDIEKLKTAVPELASSLIMPPKKNLYNQLCVNVSKQVFQDLRNISPELVEDRLSLKLTNKEEQKEEASQSVSAIDAATATSQNICPFTIVNSPHTQSNDSYCQTPPVDFGTHSSDAAAVAIDEDFCIDKEDLMMKSGSPAKQVGDAQAGTSDSYRLSCDTDAVNQSVEQSSESVSSRRHHWKGHLASDTSPEVETSQEFTTADFYFDESMPSSIEAPLHKGIPKEDLQKMLQEKCELSEKLSRELQACRASFGVTLDKLKALKNTTERSLPEFREQLCELHELMRQNQIDFIRNASHVEENLMDAIRMFNENKDKERADNFLAFQKEHEIALQMMTEKLGKANEQIKEMEQENSALEEELRQNKNQCELLSQKISFLEDEKEKSLKQLSDKCQKEMEVGLDKQRSEYEGLLAQKNEEMSQVSNNLECAQCRVDQLMQDISNMSDTFSETNKKEKAELIEKLESSFMSEKMQAVEEAKQLLIKEHTASLESLKLDYANLDEEYKSMQSKLNAEKEQALHSLHCELSTTLNAAMSELNQNLTSKLTECEANLKQTQAELLEYRQLAARPKQCDGQCQTSESVISVADFEQKLRESTSDYGTKLEAEKTARQEESLRHQQELKQLRASLEAEYEEKLNVQRKSLIAEKQVIFNQALAKLTTEKDQTNKELQQQIEELTANINDLKQEEEVSKQNNEEIIKELAEKLEEKTNEDRLENELKSAIAKVAATESSNRRVSSEENADEGYEEESVDKLKALKKTIRSKDERIEKLQSKVMELSMSASVFDQDKVSITSFQSGDLVLLCLDEEHGHYVVFTVGNTLHFLHTDCLDNLGLRSRMSTPREPWVLGIITDKEYCIAKKYQNRYRVPMGTKFYRVRAKPWPKDPRLTRENSGQVPSVLGSVGSSPPASLSSTTTTTTSGSTAS